MATTIPQIDALLTVRSEDEHLEFKAAENRYDFEELVDYCLAFHLNANRQTMHYSSQDTADFGFAHSEASRLLLQTAEAASCGKDLLRLQHVLDGLCVDSRKHGHRSLFQFVCP